MRISEFEIESIKKVANKHFGKDVQVFLFGSRTMDQLRGGDIDLFIRNQNKERLEVRSKIKFITDLILLIGDQKIDVVLYNQAAEKSGFFQTIQQTGIRLC